MKRTFHGLAVPGITLLLLLMGACARGDRDDMSWARAALDRNPSIEVVAVDTKGRTFTVRVKGTSELRIVRVDDIVGLPTPGGGASPSSAAPAPSAPAPAAPASAPAMPAPGAPASAAADAMAAATTIAVRPPLPTAPGPLQASLVPQQPGTVAGQQERVLESGPGYTIRAVGSAVPAAAVPGVTSSPLQHRHEPIVCQGSRLVHIDNQNLAFDGDAVSAEDGCEIHITNSHISATGVGVSARAANVHIDNCLIEGRQASIDATEGAQVYAADTRFKGLSRRLDSASFHDLGGNIWN